jgi:ketosteroid isomerase-like protein
MPRSIAFAGLVLLLAIFSLLPTMKAGSTPAAAPAKIDDAQIRAVLDAQIAAWNRGDIDSFMSGYWKSDETEFIGANGITRGWQAVLDRYRRNYPDHQAMGQLSFANLEIHVTCADAAYVIGEFHLESEKDRPSGVFTLNFRRFSDGWRIVTDHTTAYPAR